MSKKKRNSTSFLLVLATPIVFMLFLFIDPALELLLRSFGAWSLLAVFLILVGFDGWLKGFTNWPEEFPIDS